jgi:hypothetical protein
VRGKLQTERQLENTRKKLQSLEDHYNARWHEESPISHVGELSRQSIKRTINQLKEEVIWCETHLAAGENPPGAPVTRLRGSGFGEGRSKVIPELDQYGNLPPGIHSATLAEVEERFGRSTEVRRTQMQSLYWLADLAKPAGIERLIVNGSFVTDVFEPNDVDCVLLIGIGLSRDRQAFRKLCKGLPFIHMQIVHQRQFDRLVNRVFSTDRRVHAKGVVEVSL